MSHLFDSNGYEPLLGSNKRPSRRRYILTASLVLFGASCVYMSRQLPTADIRPTSLWSDSKVVLPGISASSFEYGQSQCEKNKFRQQTNTTRKRHRNPRGTNDRVLIENGHLWLQDHYLEGDIYLENGLIVSLGKNLSVPEGTRRLDAGGRVFGWSKCFR
ncbi:hypothetical protein G6F56_009209 [Rhizopus delemar]|nr:hypothetical protein G6F56_009209 [Rhizopus delemar]